MTKRNGDQDMIEQATIVKIYPTKIWIESGMMGERVVVIQHEGCEPFDYATFAYDYRYTSNYGTMNAAQNLAISLGATDPVEQKLRPFTLPTAEELQEQINMLTECLGAMVKEN